MAATGEKIKVYACSNVGIDYFFFLCKTIGMNDYEVQPVSYLPEHTYRTLAKSRGLKKVWLRVQMYVLYPVMLFFKALGAPKGSIFVVTSNTFYAPLVVKMVSGIKKLKVIHLLYDLYPDAMEVAGKTGYDSAISKLIGKITKLNQRTCDGTVYLGNFLKQHAENRWGKAKKGETIHISTDLSLYHRQFNKNLSHEKIIIHYGGQLGYLHDAVSIIECVKDTLSSDLADKVEFNFYVSGAQAHFLETSLEGYNVKIISAVPSSEWRKDITGFHIGLVSLSPGGASVCLPSKTYGMMAGGMAILGICPAWSDLASLITDADGGWIINNSAYTHASELHGTDYLARVNKKNDLDAIKKQFRSTLEQVLADASLLNRKRENAFNGVRDQHQISVLAKQWDQYIRNL